MANGANDLFIGGKVATTAIRCEAVMSPRTEVRHVSVLFTNFYGLEVQTEDGFEEEKQVTDPILI